MKKNGFTLIELLGTILLISLLVVIITPGVDKAVKRGKKAANEQAIENIRMAAENWATDNKASLPTSGSTNISIETLQNGRYIDGGIDLPKDTNNQSINCVEIKKIQSANAYKYTPKHCS